jgi:hypothetical protein
MNCISHLEKSAQGKGIGIKKMIVLVVALGCISDLLPARSMEHKNILPASADTAGTQKMKLKEQIQKKKNKMPSPVREQDHPMLIDSFKMMLDRPLLRLKDSSQNNIH